MDPDKSPLEKTLHVGCPNVGDMKVFEELMKGVFDRRWFTNHGQLVQTLEARLEEYLHVNHCILVCNATVGLQLACHSLDLTGEVIVPAFTFVATPHAVQWERLKAVFVDVPPNSHNMDVSQIESRITSDTSAILGVHVWGVPCNTQAIHRIADKHGLACMFDAAHAFGCRHEGQMIGNFGDCEVFSFHATKFFNTFEGGAITTNDDALAEKIRLMQNFGFSGMDNVVHLGTNAKMTEVCAAMGLTGLDHLDEFLSVNKTNYECYRAGLAGVPGVTLLSYDQQEATNWQYIVLEVDAEKAGLTRDDLMNVLHDRNVRARRYFYPGCHRMEPYRSLTPEQIHDLPRTDRLCNRVLCLPTGTAVDSEDIASVCEFIQDAVHPPKG